VLRDIFRYFRYFFLDFLYRRGGRRIRRRVATRRGNRRVDTSTFFYCELQLLCYHDISDDIV